jgi:hypothetical protein
MPCFHEKNQPPASATNIPNANANASISAAA